MPTRAARAAAELWNPAVYQAHHLRICRMPFSGPKNSTRSVACRRMAAVHDALVPGGLFLFELNLPGAYERYWSGTESTALPDAVVVREHRRSAGIVEALIRIDHVDGTTVRDRIAQRPYGDAEIEDALAAAGLDLVAVERFNPFEAGAAPVKALWSAQRARA